MEVSTQTKSILATYEFKGPSDQTIYLSLNSGDLISGDLNHGIFEKTITLNSLTQPGTWRLANYYLSDRRKLFLSCRLSPSQHLEYAERLRRSCKPQNAALADALG